MTSPRSPSAWSRQRGQIVVGRAQLYDGGGRLGYSMTLASPSRASQWWFANGLKGPDVAQRFSLYNPTDEDVEVTPLFLGISEGVTVEPIAVPAREVVTFSSDGVAGLPDGRHALVFATADSSDVDRRRAGDHAHDRRHPDDVGAARGDGAGRGRLRPDDVDVRRRTG